MKVTNLQKSGMKYLYADVSVSGIRCRATLGISVKEGQWKPKSQMVRGGADSETNILINDMKTGIMELVRKLQREGRVGEFEIKEGIGTHLYIVEVNDFNGCSNRDSINITIDYNVRTGDASVSNTTIYPNPSEGILNIKSDAQLGLVEVVDVNGRKVISTVNQNQIDISRLESGVYYVNVFNQASDKLSTVNLVKK